MNTPPPFEPSLKALDDFKAARAAVDARVAALLNSRPPAALVTLPARTAIVAKDAK